MEFWNIYRLIKARRWMILGLMLITLAVIFVAKKAVDEQTQYTASAIVLPDQTAMSPQGFFQSNQNGLMSPTTDRYARMAMFTQSIQAQFNPVMNLIAQTTLVQKQTLVRALASQLPPQQAHLALLPKNFNNEDKLDSVLSAFGIPTSDTIWRSRPDLSTSVENSMQSSLVAQPIVDNNINTTPGSPTPTGVLTDYLQVGVSAPGPNLAQQVSNLLAASFINFYHTQGLDEYDNTINSVRDAQRQAQQQLDQAENAIVNFKRANPLLDVSSSVSSGVGNMVGLEQSLQQAQVQEQVAKQAVASYDQLAKAAGTSLVIPLNPLARPQAQQLQTQIANLQEQIVALGSVYTAANPAMIQAKAALKAHQQELRHLLHQPYDEASANNEYIALRSQADQERATEARAAAMISALNAKIAQQKAQNETLPAQERTISELVSNLSAAQQMKTQADANVASMTESMKLLNQGLISFSTPAASAAPSASGPSLTSLLIYGAILSLIIGIAIALGLDYLDNSVQTIPDAEKLLGMPISAVIPAMPAGDPRRMTRLTVSDPLSPIAESYRLLRTDLLFTAEEKPFQSLMAATAKPGQGATTTICNLAVALANVGKRVILIDADLRRPKLHDFFNVSNEVGLTSLLRDECEMEEALKVTDIDNLLVLPSGPLPLNPAELLASQKMRALHERLKPHTDFILVDTPSAIAFSDSSILASYLDAVMIVVRAQETPRGSEMQLKNLLNKARANVVGVVLNGVKPQLVDSYYYHAAYYPQVSAGNLLGGGGDSNSGILSPPPPQNGTHGRNGNTRTLEAETLGQAVSQRPVDMDNIEATAVMDDDIVTVTPPQPKSRFNIRKMFGNDNRE